MASLIEEHETNTGNHVETAVADSQYGTKENFLFCSDKGIKAHIPALKHLNENTKGIFSEDRFTYDTERDTVICPAGKQLKRRTLHAHTQNIEYAASKKDCRLCSLKPQCTRSKGVRTIQRHVRQEELNHMFTIAKTWQAKGDIKIRQNLMERSYARSKRFGFDRSRWRGLWKVAIQEYLISAIQNIQALIRYIEKPTKGVLTLSSLTIIKRDICQSIGLFMTVFSLYILRTRESSKNHYLLPTL